MATSLKASLQAGIYSSLQELFTTPEPRDPNLKLQEFAERLSTQIDTYVDQVLKASVVTGTAVGPGAYPVTGIVTPPPGA